MHFVRGVRACWQRMVEVEAAAKGLRREVAALASTAAAAGRHQSFAQEVMRHAGACSAAHFEAFWPESLSGCQLRVVATVCQNCASMFFTCAR